MALLLKGDSFQTKPPIRFYPQFLKAIPDHKVGYLRVTEQPAGVLRPQDLHGLTEL